MSYQIIKSSTDGKTGHTEVKVRAKESDGTFGPLEVYGIDSSSLVGKYLGGKPLTSENIMAGIQLWLSQFHDASLARKRHIDALTQATHAIEGRVLEF